MMIKLKRFVLGMLCLFAMVQVSQGRQQQKVPDDLIFTEIKDSPALVRQGEVLLRVA